MAYNYNGVPSGVPTKNNAYVNPDKMEREALNDLIYGVPADENVDASEHVVVAELDTEDGE